MKLKLGHKIRKVLGAHCENFTVKLLFDDGISNMVSLAVIFNRPIGLSAEILKGGMFDKCFVESGALAWPNGFELCPDALYQWMLEQRKRAA